MSNYSDKINKYFPFTLLEARNIVLTILIIGFMFGFNDGADEFNLIHWSYNLLVSVGIVAIVMIVFLTGQRIAGLSAGYRVEFQMWWPGLILALIITFIARGHIWIPIAGGMLVHHMSGHRLGFFRYGLNMLDNGIIAASGPLATVIFGTVLKQIANWFGPPAGIPIIDKIYFFALIFALVNMIPIPPLAGSKLIYNSRLPFIFIFSFMVAYAILAAFGVFSWILALLIALLLWLWYYIKVEAA
ncbi:hypothetical protein H6503_01845 [Candidatus Woesearchaeota archaeon]|nr:hypothetical protein [Candidatus Woesearchaeota archaeon]